MKYAIQYKPTRQNFVATMTDSEAAAVTNHFHYLKGMMEAGVLMFAGRREDSEFGIAIFESESDSSARKIMENDPAVTSGVFSATVGQFHIALSAWPETP